MNGPNTLSARGTLFIATAWKDAKDRERVNDRVNMAGLVHSDGFELEHMIDRFILCLIWMCMTINVENIV